MRKEKDFLGEVELPDSAYYGIHTQRAYDNFGDIRETVDPVFIRSYLQVKKACSLTNKELGYLDPGKADYILSAIEDLLQNKDYRDIIINPLCGGAGTSVNMNINEVIANKACEKAGRARADHDFIHPLDHVNMHQSTNDTFPTALKVAVLLYLERLEENLVRLQDELQKKEKEYAGIIKLGRTELQDALPVTVGMQFSAYSEAIARDRWRIFKARERIKLVNLGGTAIGTGFNAPQRYIFRVIEVLKELTGLNIARGENLLDITQNMDSLAEVSGLIKTIAVNLLKISEDLRVLSSGPEGGFHEISLPRLQEGSTIMPGKVNPVILEFVSQNSLLVIHQDAALSTAAGLGNLELNQFIPLIAYLLLRNLKIINLSIEKLDGKVIRGLQLNKERIERNFHGSMALLTYLSQYIGHDKAGEIYQQALKTGKPIRQLLSESGALTEERLSELLSPERIRMMGIKNE
ncbi:MAG: aspartate ammonia-lyase [bacterium]|nr:aspartate ammonia-lyase [bacterium]